jgi:hypothetical protein
VEEIYTAVPVINEEVTEVIITQVSQATKSLDTRENLSLAEGDYTTTEQTHRPLKRARRSGY